MTWSLETSCGFESDKIAAFCVPYTRGLVLDVGCGMKRCWPHFVGVDTGGAFGRGDAAVIIKSADSLDCFGDDSWDAVFSSHCLEHIEDTEAALTDWWRVVKPGGHLVLYLPHADLYPRKGQPGANPDHKWDFQPSDIIEYMKEVAWVTGRGWDMLEDEVRGETNEYSFFQVYRKRADSRCLFDLWQRNPHGQKRALVVRFGAIGDQIQASSILPLLKEQGFHLTYMTTPVGYEVLQRDPSIDAWWIQDKDQVPNPQLGPYLATVASRYDKVVNLCESVEGSLLAIPGRPNHAWSDEARRAVLGTVNYLERMHDIANVPHRFNPRFYPTEEERRTAEVFKRGLDGPVVYWAIGGSSLHKIYPFTNVVATWLLERGIHVVLGAGPDTLQLEAGIYETIAGTKNETVSLLQRLHKTGGIWDIRRALTFTEYADVVVGPETGVVNAASHLDTPTVLMLSHSSCENLPKHWRHTIVLEPENTPCFSCHRMHYDLDHCHFVEETGGTLCASNIRPERLFEAILAALGDKDADDLHQPGRVEGDARLDPELDQSHDDRPRYYSDRGAGHHLQVAAALADEG